MLKIWFLNKTFAIDTSETETEHTLIKEGQTYRIQNNSASEYTFKSFEYTTSSFFYDYIVYGADDTVVSYANDRGQNITIPVNGYALVRMKNGSIVYPHSSELIITEATGPVYQNQIIYNGESYEFTNNSDTDLNITVKYSWWI